MTTVDRLRELLGPVCQFRAVCVHYSHTVLVIMENRRHRHRIQSFWYRFPETFQVVLAVFAHIVLGGTPKSSKKSVRSRRKRKRREIPLNKIEFAMKLRVEYHKIPGRFYFFLQSAPLCLEVRLFTHDSSSTAIAL